MSSLLESAIADIKRALETEIPKKWDGRDSILQMKDEGSRHWRQLEWIGFYFEHLCGRALQSISEVPSPNQYGNVSFDCFREIDWDFKAHAMNTSSHQIIVNDTQAILSSIEKFGHLGLILALGKVLYNDEQRTFQKWHEEIKGGMSEYSKQRIARGAWSRLRKVEFDLQQITFILLSKETLEKCGSFQKDFRNADGSPRNTKVLLDLEKIDAEIVDTIEY